MKYIFPDNLYTEIRIEDFYQTSFSMKNNIIENNTEVSIIGARIRIFDGNMWYTTVTNNIESIQLEINNLAQLATPNKKILENDIIKNCKINKAKELHFQNEENVRHITQSDKEKICQFFYSECKNTLKEIDNSITTNFYATSIVKSLFTSKGSEIIQDYQRCIFILEQELFLQNGPYTTIKQIYDFYYKNLFNQINDVKQEIIRNYEFAINAKPIQPGNYICVLSPEVTSVFTHEIFGHKSESDYMLNDKTLQKEWILGKQVGNKNVTILDDGKLFLNGYCPYDDEGNKKECVYLIKKGILVGRLHDAKSATILKEKPTGNARAQSFYYNPLVRMTNTYMKPGKESPDEIIASVKDGIYIYNYQFGTGNSIFTIKPKICYRIKNGKISEPINVSLITGSVFQTLFDIESIGNDLKFYSGTCGKENQFIPTTTGGPTIKVKKLTIN